MEETISAFQDVDSELRLVMSMSQVNWELEYVRDDVDDVYSESDFETTYRKHMGNQISSDDIERTVDSDEFYGQAYLFEDILAFQFSIGRYESLLVSYDWDGSFPIDDVTTAVEEADI